MRHLLFADFCRLCMQFTEALGQPCRSFEFLVFTGWPLHLRCHWRQVFCNISFFFFVLLFPLHNAHWQHPSLLPSFPFFSRPFCVLHLRAYLAPPPPPTTLIPHIEVGFKWMWTQLATPNKMAPVFVDLCAGLVMLLPRQIRRFRHGILFVSCPRLKLEELSSREAPLKATNRGQSTVSSLIFSFPERRHYEVKSRCRSAGKSIMVNLLTKQYQTSSLSPPWVRNLDFENSL